MVPERVKRPAGAVSVGGQEGLGSRAQREATSPATEGRAGVTAADVRRWGEVVKMVEIIFWWHLFSHPNRKQVLMR